MFSRLIQLAADFKSHVKSEGPREAIKYVMHRLHENYHERRLGITTGHMVSLKEKGINNPEFQEYGPAVYYAFKTVMKDAVAATPEGGVFLDYGCGMGRALILAAAYPFREIIGVELCSEFVAIARENLKRVEGKVKCKDIRIITIDATQYEMPDEVTHIHLYNPFGGETLAAVVENIRKSVARRPRRLTVLVSNSDDFDRLVQQTGFLSKRRAYSFYPKTSYAIYESRTTL